MDWGKVDAPLASALAGAAAEEPLSVFVQIDRSRAKVDPGVLERLGLGPDPAALSTARLSAAQVDALTDEEWVLSVRFSGRLRSLRQPDAPSAPAGPPAGKDAEGQDQRRRPKKKKG